MTGQTENTALLRHNKNDVASNRLHVYTGQTHPFLLCRPKHACRSADLQKLRPEMSLAHKHFHTHTISMTLIEAFCVFNGVFGST